VRRTASILRILRMSRILTRIQKLRALSSALLRAFGGVVWIFVLVLITTYAFSIIGVMTFKIGANEEVSCARRLLCPWKPSPLLRGRAD
jgi:predicted permease